ncbi:hypothetical protein ANN_08301 [Periplaneta americana]|uniref:Endonuclease-reverse transcriptase n=1 Tax=Periplaneta americana TaxID=6978 RepID=A0ABQ8T2E5_PERAM|nr:hypothetical protein ANN_08301 [Periplaneta americana]
MRLNENRWTYILTTWDPRIGNGTQQDRRQGGETIPEVNKCKYLGITFSSDLGWGEHVTDTVGKAWRALHFVMRVLRKGSDKSKEIAYKSLVRPVMEYGAACWDPYRLEHIKTLEKIQKRAFKRCRKNSPLKWDTLTDRKTRIRLCALFKTYRGEPAWREIKIGCNRQITLQGTTTHINWGKKTEDGQWKVFFSQSYYQGLECFTYRLTKGFTNNQKRI